MNHEEWEKRRRAVMLHFAKGWRRAFRKDMRELARAAQVDNQGDAQVVEDVMVYKGRACGPTEILPRIIKAGGRVEDVPALPAPEKGGRN